MNKEVCKYCYQRVFEFLVNKNGNTEFFSTKKWQWNEYDDIEWKNGWIRCPFNRNKSNGSNKINIKKQPEYCPYLTEHVVSENVK